jgi:phospholipid/cholesterol/gamma-HCH transport system permease protein
MLENIMKEAKTVIANGPLGLYEKGWLHGSEQILTKLANAPVDSYIGGGDTVSVAHSLHLLKKFTFVSLGGGAMLGQVLVAIVVRELGPLITALIVIARSGTAVASEIGNMKANRETDALEVMGINPLSYIVFPRIIGGVISVICLSLYYIFVALLGGFLVARLTQEYSLQYYIDQLAQAITLNDFFLFLLKTTFGGTIIFVVSCYQGLLVKESPHEVPQVTTKAVVNSIIYVVSFNLTVTVLSYLSTLARLGVL